MMATVKQVHITYGIPGSEPIGAELVTRDGEAMVLGHGYLWKLREMGVTVEPLVLATQERIDALEMAFDLLPDYFDEMSRGGQMMAVLRAMLLEMKGATDVE